MKRRNFLKALPLVATSATAFSKLSRLVSAEIPMSPIHTLYIAKPMITARDLYAVTALSGQKLKTKS